MSESKKMKEHMPPPGRPVGEPATRVRRVRVTSTYRNRPMLFHFPGGSMRLGPGETQEIHHSALTSPELAQLVRTGGLLVSETRTAGARPGGGGESGGGPMAGGSVEHAGSRAGKKEEK